MSASIRISFIPSHDEVTETRYHHMPEVVVFAENTEQVAAVVKLANKELVTVVPRGAGTGLACGAVPIHGGIVLSLEKMNKIIEMDPVNMSWWWRLECVRKMCKKPPEAMDCFTREILAAGTVALSAGTSLRTQAATRL